jgi:predicted small metal-binding protein
MKQMTCAQMGGPATCSFVITSKTAEEMATNGMAHVTSSHPELAEQIKKMTAEETSAWMSDFSKKFEALQEI